ncbi:aminomethyltransferase, mitochondrial [Anopheles ziemanni]|uniref:aminomethyltransferase, mitochondrial n=1 Tax=Anopheles coustani TaxID=139045 RepID=UPI00265849B4|nr:aminomethyltransferase, mitochondrial [Anopheles coustani]XP_058129414.1 aminomethyltransferase, mitochondrial [Anopheles coustani]XP_058171691.1 aminomethyltransferase, mitochondrial [Anopheles ziemanni]
MQGLISRQVLRTARNGVPSLVAPLSRAFSSNKTTSKTALYEFHQKHGGKLVDFAGYLLPVQYNDQSIIKSHLYTREIGSIFDVSHMLQTYLRGKDVIRCFETICTADVKGLRNGSGTLTVFTNSSGGIIDDLIVNRVADDVLYVVSNASRKEVDMANISDAVSSCKAKGMDVSVEFLSSDDQSLLAVQGPSAVATLQKLCTKDLSRLFFMNSTTDSIAGVDNCRITRCGYTGEDGVEISIPSANAADIATALLDPSYGNLKLAGLGARDSLRVEAGLCLYGNDIDETTTPVEANLLWLVAKTRRSENNFPGSDKINAQIKNGVTRRRVGFKMDSGAAPARQHVEIYNNEQQKVGEITSGCPSPCLQQNIAMGYIREEYKKPGTEITLKVRDKHYHSSVVKMPFVATHYYQPPK